jgi:hypothetical protein
MGKHLFRSHEDFRCIFEVYAECGGMNETARRTGIPETTVKRYLSRYKTLERFDAEYNPEPKIMNATFSPTSRMIFVIFIALLSIDWV